MQRLHVGEVALRRPLQRDVCLSGADRHLDAPTIESGKRILQTNSEFANHKRGLAPLLGILVLGQVLVVKPAAEVRDVPAVAPLDDLWFGSAAERLLVERVRDDLADRLGHAPVVEDLLDIEVEKRCLFPSRAHPRPLLAAGRGCNRPVKASVSRKNQATAGRAAECLAPGMPRIEYLNHVQVLGQVGVDVEPGVTTVGRLVEVGTLHHPPVGGILEHAA